jgi:hypothetical protein
MTKDEIKMILDNESSEFFEVFCETLMNEINSDDETYDKKGRHLLVSALTCENHNDFFVSICGWTLDSLISKTKENNNG